MTRTRCITSRPLARVVGIVKKLKAANARAMAPSSPTRQVKMTKTRDVLSSALKLVPVVHRVLMLQLDRPYVGVWPSTSVRLVIFDCHRSNDLRNCKSSEQFCSPSMLTKLSRSMPDVVEQSSCYDPASKGSH